MRYRMTAKRDPKKDPRKGDRFRNGKIRRDVTGVHDFMGCSDWLVEFIEERGEVVRSKSGSLKSFRAWARHAEVLRHA